MFQKQISHPLNLKKPTSKERYCQRMHIFGYQDQRLLPPLKPANPSITNPSTNQLCARNLVDIVFVSDDSINYQALYERSVTPWQECNFFKSHSKGLIRVIATAPLILMSESLSVVVLQFDENVL